MLALEQVSIINDFKRREGMQNKKAEYPRNSSPGKNRDLVLSPGIYIQKSQRQIVQLTVKNFDFPSLSSVGGTSVE